MSEKILGSEGKKEYGFTMDRRQRLLKRLDTAWRDFRDSYSGLSEAELLKPGVIGQWAVKDIIAHVTTWEEEALKHLPALLRGERLPRYSVTHGGIDSFNAQAAAGKKDFSLSEVFRQSDQIHRKLIDLIESVPEEQLDSKARFRHRLRLDTYGHYMKHTEAVRRWRKLNAGLE